MSRAPLPPLVLRVDASTQIGTGHVMRCLALAQAWQDAGGLAHFAVVELPDGLAARLTAEGMTLHRLDVPPGSPEDAAQTTTLAQRLGAAWVVEDGYHFGADYQRTIKDFGLRLLAIDDYGHADHYVADLVLNQNIYADESLYPSRAPETRLLLCTQYVLLRREFLHWRGWQREFPDVARKVLVTMGGSDPDNVTLKVIQALEAVQIEELEVVVVVGASNPHRQILAEAVRHSPTALRLAHDVKDMPELMAEADLAVTAAGSTCWELAFMGVPFITTVLADNQRQSARYLKQAGVTEVLEFGHTASPGERIILPASIIVDPRLRADWSQRSLSLVRGDGALRFVGLLRKDSNGLSPYDETRLT